MRILVFLFALLASSPAWANCGSDSRILYPLTSHVLQLQDSGAAWTGAIGATNGNQTYCVRVYSQVLSYLTMALTTATAPATSSDIPLPAGSVEHFKVYSGQYIGVVRDGNAGRVTITEMTQ